MPKTKHFAKIECWNDSCNIQVIYNSSDFGPCYLFAKNIHDNSESIERKFETKNPNLSRTIFLRIISVFDDMARKQIII